MSQESKASTADPKPCGSRFKRGVAVFHWWSVLVAVMILFFPATLAAQLEKPTRIAVLTQEGKLMVLVDLVTADLTKISRLEVMERVEVERVLREQSLSLATVNGAVQAGKLLGVDGLLICEVRRIENESKLVARLVAVKPGVVLSLFSKTMPEPRSGETFSYPNTIKELLDKVGPYFSKLEISAGQAIPLSLLNLRSTASTPAALEMEQSLNAMLLERLSSDPALLVLERRQLDSLTWEKELMGVADSPFWNGSYFLEGTIDPQELSQTEVTIVCQLRSKNRAEPITVRAKGPRGQPAIAISELLRKILAELKKETGGTAWSAEQEAKRYLEEAKWAYRWKLYREAQEATESSWALGLRSQELEVLRIFAYLDQARTYAFSWEMGEGKVLRISNPPDPAKIQPAIRSLELYVERTLARRQTGRELGYEWHGLGAEVIQNSAHLLRHFWFSDGPTRSEHAQELLKLRGKVRSTVEMMERDEQVKQPGWPNYAKTISPASPIFDFYTPRNLHWVKYTYGVFWLETPDEVIDMYRKMMRGPLRESLFETIVHRKDNTPNLIDWRKDNPEVLQRKWQTFTEELKNSPNIPERMLGVIANVQGIYMHAIMPEAEVRKNVLLILQAADSYNGSLASETGTAMLLAIDSLPGTSEEAIAREREANRPIEPILALRQKLSALHLRIREARLLAYREKKAEEDLRLQAEEEAKQARMQAEQKRKSDEAIATLKQRFANATKPDMSLDSDVFFLVKSKEDAKALIPYVEDYGKRANRSVIGIMNQLNRKAGLPFIQVLPKGPPAATNLNAANIPPIKKLLPKDMHFELSRYETVDYKSFVGVVVEGKKLIGMKYREGKLWVEMDGDLQCWIAAIDLRSRETKTYDLPANRREDPWADERQGRQRSFEVLGGTLYYTEPTRLVAVDTGTQTVKEIPAPLEWETRLFGIEGKLYITTESSILEFNPQNQEFRTLVSTRRRPETTFLDLLEQLHFPPVAAGPKGHIRTYLGQKAYECELATGQWREIGELPAQNIIDQPFGHPSDPMLMTQWGGTVFTQLGMGLPTVHGLFPQEQDFKYLMGGNYREGKRRGVAFKNGPQIFPQWRSGWFSNECLASWDGTNLLALVKTPRGLPAELYHMDPRFADAARMTFTYQKRPRDKAAREGEVEAGSIFLATPEGYVLAKASERGFWLLPRAELDRALATSRKEIIEATAAFEKEELELYDLNGNGKLAPEEEKNMTEAMEHFYARVRFRLNLWIQLYDKDGDDQLSEEEIAPLYADPFLPRNFAEQIRKVRLEKLDANSNGKYDIQELWNGLLDPVMKESYYRPAPTSRPRQPTN